MDVAKNLLEGYLSKNPITSNPDGQVSDPWSPESIAFYTIAMNSVLGSISNAHLGNLILI